MELGPFTLQHGHVGAANLVMGEPLPSGGLIYLLGQSEGASRFNGQAISGGNAVLFEPGHDFCLSHAHPHDWFTIRTTQPAPAQGSHTLLHEARRVEPLLRTVTSLMATAAEAPGLAASPAGTVGRRILEARLSRLSGPGAASEPSPAPAQGRPPRARQAILEACHDVLGELDHTPVSVNELAQACSVSARTLQTVFNDYFGFGPSRFLQYRQLYRVHRDLVEADPATATVSDILLSHGVWSFSHFSRRYRALFGQTPGHTLRRGGPGI
ncbi:AraC family transcriptional regulator [Synechococcus sp. RSCCF101]|uniref:helix-turn-helix transcriptional regulator n=1 Tax=Synechococcus sp. RSCCF101 TaxID=2511069 RepID=UPI00178074BC|nr:helix-turn-helix domain-containing protein [Synechococcus sp. RSCCF101]